jgi:2',3'-cyclic-nucleotide 2'-phosphodiesterase
MAYILFCGDVVGKSGRDALAHWLPVLRATYPLDAVIVNAENAAHGFGLTRKISIDLQSLGIDVLTTGNHTFDQKEFFDDITALPFVVRPCNYPIGTAGACLAKITTKTGKRLVVVNVMGRLYMDALDCPFRSLDETLKGIFLKANADIIVIDVHGEAASEKQAIACMWDGRVSLVVGTHTHVPTADYRILPNGTAYQTDAGMCGDYDSMIGMQKDIAVPRMVKKVYPKKLQPAIGMGTICGILVSIDDKTGLSSSIKPIRLGKHLEQSGL